MACAISSFIFKYSCNSSAGGVLCQAWAAPACQWLQRSRIKSALRAAMASRSGSVENWVAKRKQLQTSGRRVSCSAAPHPRACALSNQILALNGAIAKALLQNITASAWRPSCTHWRAKSVNSASKNASGSSAKLGLGGTALPCMATLQRRSLKKFKSHQKCNLYCKNTI